MRDTSNQGKGSSQGTGNQDSSSQGSGSQRIQAAIKEAVEEEPVKEAVKEAAVKEAVKKN